jgi:predicted secreted protein
MAVAGSTSLFNVSVVAGGAGTYYAVDEIRSASMSWRGGTIDISEIGNTYMQRLAGIKDASYQIQGFYDSGDTNGQVAIRGELISYTELWAQWLPDGTNGFKQQVVVATFDTNVTYDGAVELSVSLEGTGAVALV